MSGTLIKTLQGHANLVSEIAFSPNGKVIATGSWDNTVRLWDAIDYTPLRTLQLDTGITTLAYSPDGKVLALASSDTRIWLFDAISGTLLKTLTTHEVELGHGPGELLILKFGTWHIAQMAKYLPLVHLITKLTCWPPTYKQLDCCILLIPPLFLLPCNFYGRWRGRS